MKQLLDCSQVKNIRISKNWKDAENVIKDKGIVVAPTDTLYGILGDALDKEVVERVYLIKNRKPDKPYIILIPDVSFLSLFGIKPDIYEKRLLENRGITVILSVPPETEDRYQYLHRGGKTLAFRIPDKKELLTLLKRVNRPLIAPSANPENKPPARDISEAVSYFGGDIDLYIDEGVIKNKKPSTIVKISKGKPVVLREGSTSISQINHILKIK